MSPRESAGLSGVSPLSRESRDTLESRLATHAMRSRGSGALRLAGCAAYATPVEAYHPEAGCFAPMVMVRLAAGCEGAEAQWAGGLHMAGRRWAVFPMTQLRPASHGPPREAMEARRLWDGLRRPGVAGAPRSTSYTMVAEHTPLDAASEECGPSQALALVREPGGGEEGGERGMEPTAALPGHRGSLCAAWSGRPARHGRRS